MCTTETGSFNVLLELHAKVHGCMQDMTQMLGQGWDRSNRIVDKLEGAKTASNLVMDRIGQVVADKHSGMG